MRMTIETKVAAKLILTFSKKVQANYKSYRLEVFYEKGFRLANLLKKRLWHRCFPVNFAKFLRTPFFIK